MHSGSCFQDVLGLDWEKIKIKRPRKNKHLPVILSKEEVSKMIEVTDNLKHKAIMALLYSSGIRRDELLKMRPADIDSKRMLIRIPNGKRKINPEKRYLLTIHWIFSGNITGVTIPINIFLRVIARESLIQRPLYRNS
jgi:integrase/recombinase XerD